MDFPINNHQQESERIYQQCLSWVTVCDQLLLSKEGGHGVIWPLTFHSVGLHFLFSGFPSFIYAVVRPLPLIDLHDLLWHEEGGPPLHSVPAVRRKTWGPWLFIRSLLFKGGRVPKDPTDYELLHQKPRLPERAWQSALLLSSYN